MDTKAAVSFEVLQPAGYAYPYLNFIKIIFLPDFNFFAPFGNNLSFKVLIDLKYRQPWVCGII